MVVGCPKCKTRLKVPDERIKPEGTRFKCPKCAAALLIKKPALKPAQPLQPPRPSQPLQPPQPQQKVMPPQPMRPAVQPPKTETPLQKAVSPKIEPPKVGPIAPPMAPPKAPATPAKPISMEPPIVERPIIPPRPLVSEKPVISERPSMAEKPVMPVPPVSEGKKILLAYAGKETLERFKTIALSAGFAVSVAEDGITAMVKAMNERPSAVFVDVALPKISGYEVSKRLKTSKDTKEMKTFLISSATDALRQRKGSANSFGADDYIDANAPDSDLIRTLSSIYAPKAPSPLVAPELKVPAEASKPAPPLATAVKADPEVERARRLVRAVLSDIELYSPQKAQEAVINGSYEETFEKELKDGLKHYENRISLEVRQRNDYFREELETYLEKRKKALSL